MISGPVVELCDSTTCRMALASTDMSKKSKDRFYMIHHKCWLCTSYSNSFGRFVVTLTKKTVREMERAPGLAFMGLQMAWYLMGIRYKSSHLFVSDKTWCWKMVGDIMVGWKKMRKITKCIMIGQPTVTSSLWFHVGKNLMLPYHTEILSWI